MFQDSKEQYRPMVWLTVEGNDIADKLANEVSHQILRGEISVPGLFVPKTFLSQERIVPMENFRSRDFSFPGTFVPFPGTSVPGERMFLGTFVPWTFRSEELSFLRLFYKALTINADSYSNCQNLFRRCVHVVFFC